MGFGKHIKLKSLGKRIKNTYTKRGVSHFWKKVKKYSGLKSLAGRFRGSSNSAVAYSSGSDVYGPTGSIVGRY